MVDWDSMYDLIFALNFAEKSLSLNKKGGNPKAQQPQKQNYSWNSLFLLWAGRRTTWPSRVDVNPSAHFFSQHLRFCLRSLFTRVNGNNSSASTNARWKVLNCHVRLQNDQVHFCISVPVFALDVGTCPFRGVSSVFGKRKTRLRAIGSRNRPWERLVLT